MSRGEQARGTARGRAISALHAGRRALGWDDERYRAQLEALTGKRSASELSDAQLALVLDDMRRRGFARAAGEPGAKPARTERATQVDKARALWKELAAIGEVRNPTDIGFCHYVERMTKKSRPEWCTPEQLSKIIEGLKAWLARASAERGLGVVPPGE